MNQNTDTSNWIKINLPRGENLKYLNNHKGIVWYRKNINIPADWNNKNLLLNLGLIRGLDAAWLNGKKIGTTLEAHKSHWYRSYSIPHDEFKTGENTIVICNFSNNIKGGPRGPNSQMKIFPESNHSSFMQLTGEWLCKKDSQNNNLPPLPFAFSIGQNSLAVHYNSRIHTVIPFAIRGVLWYQGESNRNNAGDYKDLFVTMIKSWRDEWAEGNFPFYFVQIAPYNYGETYNSTYLQEAQFKTLNLTNTGMAVTMDIGDINNIHPKNKKDVGYRLALWALAKNYGFTNLVCSGPLYKNYKIDGNKIIITFNYADGLKSRDGNPLSYFEIAGKNNAFHPASAKIINDKIEVECDKIKNPMAVRFAWSNTAEPNLCNAAGLPASPFRTDN